MLRIWLAACVLAIGGCDGSSASTTTNAHTGANKQDDDGGTDATPTGACFDPDAVHAFCSDVLANAAPSSDTKPAPIKPWLRASDVAPDARLVAIGGFGALALVGPAPGEARAVLAPPLDAFGGENTNVMQITWPSGGSNVRAIDVWGREPGRSPQLVVLLCSAAICVLAGGTPGTDMVLSPLPYTPVPLGVTPVGLTVIDDMLCVFGNGLACLHGTAFVMEIASRPGLMLRDVVEGDPSIAIGDHGVLFLHERGGQWKEQLTRTTSDLALASADSQTWWAASPGGNFVEAAAQDTRACTQTPVPKALALRNGLLGTASISLGTVVDEHGNVFARFPSKDGPAWCRGAALPRAADEMIGGTTSILCGYNRRLFVLTPQAIYAPPVLPGDHSWSWTSGRMSCSVSTTTLIGTD